MKLPLRRNIRRVDPLEDPLPFYYRPLIGWAYRYRLRMGLDLLGPGRFDHLLDIGYGSGIFMHELLRRSSKVTGVDRHQRGGWVREMLRKEVLEASLTTGDLLRLPFAGERFDAVVCMSVLEHITAIDDAVLELRRVLRPGGVLVFGVPRTDSVMNGLFRVLGLDPVDKHHVGDARTILSTTARHMSVEGTLTLPRWLPPGRALYTVCRARKR